MGGLGAKIPEWVSPLLWFCAGVPAETPQMPSRTVALDLSDPDALHVLITALKDYANRAEEIARRDGGSFARWAGLADQIRAQAEAGS